MKFINLILFSFIFSLHAQARKPAVEEFVGVIPENYQVTPKGTEVLFNFKKELKEKSQNNPDNHIFQSSTSLSSAGTYGLLMFITLPFLMWYGLTRTTHKDRAVSEASLNSTEQELVSEAKMINKDKVAKLEDYRRKKEEDQKKVS
jgi:hypothetical protein